MQEIRVERVPAGREGIEMRSFTSASLVFPLESTVLHLAIFPPFTIENLRTFTIQYRTYRSATCPRGYAEVFHSRVSLKCSLDSSLFTHLQVADETN